jgi:predicted Zn finger-like uncharacterized protein
MILECPNCETCYEIPEDLPPEGRKVRCASCQHVWNATNKNQPKADIPADIFDDGEIVFKNDDEMDAEPPAEPDADAGNSQDSIDDIFAQDTEAGETQKEPDDDATAIDVSDGDFTESAMEEVFTSAMKESDSIAENYPVEETQEAESTPIVIGKAKKRRRFVPGNIAAGWAALAIILGGVASYVYYGRIAVVRILPGAAATYERLGLPVNVRGLEFDKIKYSWETSAGRPVLEVYGDIVNVTSEPLKVPTVVFGLRTKEKVEVYQWAADVRSELLPGGQRTAFNAQIPTPPKSIRDVQVRFAKVR